MKRFLAMLIPAILVCGFSAFGEETNLPADPFADEEFAKIPEDYSQEVDRSRGIFFLDSKEGQYIPGSHFAHWHWTTTPTRWGKYFVKLRYISNRTKLGVQVKVGDLPAVKSYAPRTGKETVGTMVLGLVYIPEVKEYPVVLLSGDQSNVPDFTVKGIEFEPAPEGETLGQSIDGTIHLHAKTATTYSEKMRYEPKEAKDCLGFWTEKDDWAEWEFDVSHPGKFELKIVQGCGGGNEGSEVNVMINDKTFTHTVADTGGFQNWKEISLGEIDLDIVGQHRAAIVPVTKAGKAVMDVKKLVFVPVAE